MIAAIGGSSLARRRASAPFRRHRRSIGCEMLEGRRLLSAIQQDVQQLAGDLDAIQQHSNVTAAEVSAVTSDFNSIADVATVPSPATVTALRTTFRADRSNGKITRVEAVALRNDVSAVLTSANVPKSLAQQTVSDVSAVVTASGVTRADVKTIAGDIKAIVANLGSSGN
jgi:hypothetical protein